MGLTPSSMLPLGTQAPDWTLPDTQSGQSITLSQRPHKAGLLIMFICNHCPFVKHVEQELLRLCRDYHPQGIDILAISSNDVEVHPADRPDQMALKSYPFPYLYDESQDVARAYQAACTPDFFLFDAEHRLVYRGQLDGSRPGNGIPVTGVDLRAAMDALLAGKPVNPEQKPSIGCNIKWKKGWY